jgi:hypothetical protein
MKVTIDIVTDRPPKKREVKDLSWCLCYQPETGWRTLWGCIARISWHKKTYRTDERRITAWAILPPPPGKSDDKE